MRFRSLIILLVTVFVSNSVFAIEAFKSIDLEEDIAKGLTYVLLILIGLVLPALSVLIFLVLRRVTKRFWLSFGVYASCLWFALGYLMFSSLYDKANAKHGEVPIALIVVALLVIVHAIFDIEFVRNKKRRSAQS